MTSIDQLARDAINEHPELRRMLQSIMPRSPSYRYFSDARRNMYFWTTERISHDGKSRFVSGIYRYKKKYKSWTPTHKVGHAKRKGAKARALRLYQKATKS